MGSDNVKNRRQGAAILASRYPSIESMLNIDSMILVWETRGISLREKRLPVSGLLPYCVLLHWVVPIVYCYTG